MTTKRPLRKSEEQAKELGTTARYLAKARSTGTPNIPYIKIGRSVRYDPVAVDAWLAAHSHNNVEVQ
jgi:hypothetical protein